MDKKYNESWVVIIGQGFAFEVLYHHLAIPTSAVAATRPRLLTPHRRRPHLPPRHRPPLRHPNRHPRHRRPFRNDATRGVKHPTPSPTPTPTPDRQPPSTPCR